MTTNKPKSREPQFCVIGYCGCGKCNELALIGCPGDFATVSHDVRVFQRRHPNVRVMIAVDNRLARQQRAAFLKRPGVTVYKPGDTVKVIQTFPGKSPEITTEQLPPPAEGGAL